MKVIALEKKPGGDVATSPLRLWADSALVTGGRPVFPMPLPDGARWTMRLATAYRVGRLGRHVEARFAMRHIDAVTLVAVFEPCGFLTAAEHGLIDGTVVVGTWLNLDQPLALGDAKAYELPQVVERISLLASIKNGDIIIPALDDRPRQDVVIDSHVEEPLYGQPCLKFNIK